MHPGKRISAPANRVYKSKTPLPQAKFPEMKKRVTSYGKTTTKRPPKQETLTQMDFVKMQQLRYQEHEDDKFNIYEDEIQQPKRKRQKTADDIKQQPDKEDGGVEELVAKKSKKGRRKTTGNKPSSTPQYHTQTITQLDHWSFTSTPEEDQAEAPEEPPAQENKASVADLDDAVFNVPSSSQFVQVPANISSKPAEAVRQESPKAADLSDGAMGPPQTPRRTLAQEIPSSESPATPASLDLRTSEGRRSRLKEMPINIPIPFNPNRKPQTSPYKLPKLEIEDTFETATDVSQLTRVCTTPTKRSSPAKSVRFAIPDDDAEESAMTSSIKLDSTQYEVPQTLALKTLKLEILDSDAESDEDIDEEGPLEENRFDKELQPETFYGELGEDTQGEVEGLSSPPLTRINEDAQVEDDLTETLTRNNSMGSPTLTQVFEESQVEEDSEAVIYEKTQFVESQRLATQHIASMAPRTAHSDVFVSIHPQQVTNILSGSKNHDFRNWPYPPTVGRIWIYEPKPVTGLKYMAVIGGAKRPGQVANEKGMGNTEFNAKIGSQWHAYEILELYELADPLPLSKLISNEWLLKPPTKYSRVPPAVLDSLMANLLPPIFNRFYLEDDPLSSSTDTQEADAQLLNNIKHFTQPASLLQPASSKAIQAENIIWQEVIPSSQQNSPPVAFKHNLSQATTVDLTQSQTPRTRAAPEIIWESPTRPVLSSTPMKLPTPRSGGFNHTQDSIVPYSIASSQILTKSQLLPETYLDESVPGPPLFIQDSDEEDDD